MTDRYFALRRGDGSDYGLVKQSWLASDGLTFDGMEFFRMTKTGWKVDNTVFTDISGQAGDADGTPVGFDEAREIAKTLYGRGIYDYAPTVREPE